MSKPILRAPARKYPSAIASRPPSRRPSGNRPARHRAIGGGTCVSSNRSTGAAIPMGQPHVRFARSSSCPCQQQSEANDGLEKLRQPTCNHVAAEIHRERSGVRTVPDGSLHVDDGRRNGSPAASCSKQSHERHHDRWRGRDFQARLPDARSAVRLSFRLACRSWRLSCGL